MGGMTNFATTSALRKKTDLENAVQLNKESASSDFAASSGRNESGSVAPVNPRRRSLRPNVEAPKEKEAESGGFEFKLPSFSPPVKKVIVPPADFSLSATSLPLLVALFFGPSFVYLAFYILRSLDII